MLETYCLERVMGFFSKEKSIPYLRFMKNEKSELHKLQELLDKEKELFNSSSLPEKDGLSPLDMHQILYSTFGAESPIGFRDTISNKDLDKVPFLNLFEEYLSLLAEHKELKLTATGNLPPKVCKELYGKGILKEEQIESGVTKLTKEKDSMIIQNLKILADISGITKKRKNKLSLTKKGKLLCEPKSRVKLFKELFLVNCSRFNLGYHDAYPQQALHQTFGYLLLLLLRYGTEQRTLCFYAEKKILAFPSELDYFVARFSTKEEMYEHCLGVRMFERFMNYYGFIDYSDHKYSKEKPFGEPIRLQTTSLFSSIFELREDKFKFRKTKYSV